MFKNLFSVWKIKKLIKIRDVYFERIQEIDLDIYELTGTILDCTNNIGLYQEPTDKNDIDYQKKLNQYNNDISIENLDIELSKLKIEQLARLRDEYYIIVSNML